MRGTNNLLLIIGILGLLVSSLFILDSTNLTGLSIVGDNSATHNKNLDVLILLGDKVESVNDVVELYFEGNLFHNGTVNNLIRDGHTLKGQELSDYEIYDNFTINSTLTANLQITPEYNIRLNITGNKTGNDTVITHTNNSYHLNNLTITINEYQIIEGFEESNQTIYEYLNSTNQSLSIQITNEINSSNHSISNQTNTWNETISGNLTQLNKDIYINQNTQLSSLFNVSIDAFDWIIELLDYNISTPNSSISQNNYSIEAFAHTAPTIYYESGIIKINSSQKFTNIEYYEGESSIQLANLLTLEKTINTTNLNDLNLSSLYSNYSISGIDMEVSHEYDDITLNVNKLSDDRYEISGQKDELFFDFTNLTINTSTLNFKTTSGSLGSKPLNIKVIGNETNEYSYAINFQTTCNENWVCESAGACRSDNTKPMNCRDRNSCGTTFLKPSETQSCVYSCTQNWQCGDWDTCRDNFLQQRSCNDQNVCEQYKGTETKIINKTKPTTLQTCKNDCSEAWDCTTWSGCNDGTKTRTCVDRNQCGTQYLMPKVSAECSENVDDKPLRYAELFETSEYKSRLSELIAKENEPKVEKAVPKVKKVANNLTPPITGMSFGEGDKSDDDSSMIIYALTSIAILGLAFNERKYIKEFSKSKNKRNYLEIYMHDKKMQFSSAVAKIKEKLAKKKGVQNSQPLAAATQEVQTNVPAHQYVQSTQQFGGQTPQNISQIQTNQVPSNLSYNPQNTQDQLNQYINYCKQLGHSDYQIKTYLMRRGYNLSQINSAYNNNLNDIKKEMNSIAGFTNLIKEDFGLNKARGSLDAKRNFAYAKSMLEKNANEYTILESLKRKGLEEAHALEVIDSAKEKLGRF